MISSKVLLAIKYRSRPWHSVNKLIVRTITNNTALRKGERLVKVKISVPDDFFDGLSAEIVLNKSDIVAEPSHE